MSRILNSALYLTSCTIQCRPYCVDRWMFPVTKNGHHLCSLFPQRYGFINRPIHIFLFCVIGCIDSERIWTIRCTDSCGTTRKDILSHCSRCFMFVIGYVIIFTQIWYNPWWLCWRLSQSSGATSISTFTVVAAASVDAAASVADGLGCHITIFILLGYW